MYSMYTGWVEKPSLAFTTFTCLHLYIFGACTSEGISTSRNTFICRKYLWHYFPTPTQKFRWKLEIYTAAAGLSQWARKFNKIQAQKTREIK